MIGEARTLVIGCVTEWYWAWEAGGEAWQSHLYPDQSTCEQQGKIEQERCESRLKAKEPAALLVNEPY